VGECLTLGSAKGIGGDLSLLEDIFRRSSDFIPDNRRQNLTRWAALVSWEILRDHQREYEGLKQVMEGKGSNGDKWGVIDLVSAVEDGRTKRDFEETKQ